jgi:type I restriction enzyme S subunit
VKAAVHPSWRQISLGEVVTLHYGKALDKQDRDPDGPVPVYGANGIKDRSNKSLTSGPSLVVGRKGSAGEITRVDVPFWPLDVSYYTSHDPQRLDFNFLEYALRTLGLSSMARGVKPGINRNDVYSLQIPLPALDEQKRIVAVLDQAFAALDRARARVEQNLRDASAVFDSVLGSVAGEQKLLGSLVTLRTGKLDANAAVEDGQYPFFTCAREIYAIDRFAFDCEAILLAGNNAVGDFNVKHYLGKFNAYQRTYVITVNDTKQMLYRYLYFQLVKSLKHFKEQSVGAGTKFLKLGMINGLKISVPPVAQQQQIVTKLDTLLERTKDLEAHYTRKLTDLANLRQSLLQKAFSGELT